MKKLIILKPNGTKVGQPSYERILAFKKFFQSKEVSIIEKQQPYSFAEKAEIFNLLTREQIKNLFISMPQFRNWWVFLVPGINVIFDVRDAWSLAMRTGYGGTVRSQHLKSAAAKIIETTAIRLSKLTITCTPGLYDDFSKVCQDKIVLIPNGFSDEDARLVAEIKSKQSTGGTKKKQGSKIIAVCAGKFSEYGNDKVKRILSKLLIVYNGKHICVDLIGCDPTQNVWILDWLKHKGISNISINMLPLLPKRELYRRLIQADIGLTVIRDPTYDFGTKVFDYILCGLPVLDYFDSQNPFTSYFAGFLHPCREETPDLRRFLRPVLISNCETELLGALK